MAIVALPDFGADPVSITGPGLDAKVNPLATDYNGNIDNTNIASAAAIANSKLNLAAISQNIAHSGTMTHSGTVTMTAKDISEAKGADVASATTTTIWVTDGNLIHITGTTTITSFGTAGQAGDERTLIFDGALTLTHNATTLKLPGGANITTAANDRAIVRADTTANAVVVSYVKADGTAISGLTASNYSSSILTPKEYTDVSVDDTTDRTTTSSTYGDVTGETSTFTVGKQGLAFASYTARGDSGSGLGYVALLVDATIVAEAVFASGVVGNSVSLSWQGVLTAASHTIKIQQKNTDNSSTQTLKNTVVTARLRISHPT